MQYKKKLWMSENQDFHPLPNQGFFVNNSHYNVIFEQVWLNLPQQSVLDGFRPLDMYCPKFRPPQILASFIYRFIWPFSSILWCIVIILNKLMICFLVSKLDMKIGLNMYNRIRYNCINLVTQLQSQHFEHKNKSEISFYDFLQKLQYWG